METEKLEKKKYIAPAMEEIEMDCQQVLCNSETKDVEIEDENNG